jgi:hypothetical protein
VSGGHADASPLIVGMHACRRTINGAPERVVILTEPPQLGELGHREWYCSIDGARAFARDLLQCADDAERMP